MQVTGWQLDCAGKSLDLRTPKVMGIINLSPHSFSEVGRCQSRDEALRLAQAMVTDGAGIIDVGAEPTNPYTDPVMPLQQEMDYVLPVIEQLSQLPVPISLDTSKPEIMREAAKLGLGLINDVRALRLPGALTAAAATGLPVCLMHMAHPTGLADSAPITSLPSATLVKTIVNFLQQRITACEQAGIACDKIIIDPGIGGGNFGKTPAQNCYLLNHLNQFADFKRPILIGASRKTVIYNTLNIAIEDSLAGSLAATALAVANGAAIIRAHDVKQTVHAVAMSHTILHSSPVTAAQEELIHE